MIRKKALVSVLIIGVVLLTLDSIYAAEDGGSNGQKAFGAAIGAGLAMGLAALGAGIGVGHVGAAAMGAIAEKPETATWGLIFVALAEGLAIFGFAIAFLLMGKI